MVKGDKVICINKNGWAESLTINKEYEVLQTLDNGEKGVLIKDDMGYICWYAEKRFQKKDDDGGFDLASFIIMCG